MKHSMSIIEAYVDDVLIGGFIWNISWVAKVCINLRIGSYNWASEASPTLGCSIEISRDIYVSVCMSWYAEVRRRNYVAQKRACSVWGG